MKFGKSKAVFRLAFAVFFYPAIFALMIWLWVTGKHWGWGVTLIAAVLVFDPTLRIAIGTILKWRPHPREDQRTKK